MEVAKLGERLFEQVVEKKEWRSDELKSTGMLAKKICEVIILVSQSRIEEISKKGRARIMELANDVDEATNKRWNLEEWVRGVYLKRRR